MIQKIHALLGYFLLFVAVVFGGCSGRKSSESITACGPESISAGTYYIKDVTQFSLRDKDGQPIEVKDGLVSVKILVEDPLEKYVSACGGLDGYGGQCVADVYVTSTLSWQTADGEVYTIGIGGSLYFDIEPGEIVGNIPRITISSDGNGSDVHFQYKDAQDNLNDLTMSLHTAMVSGTVEFENPVNCDAKCQDGYGCAIMCDECSDVHCSYSCDNGATAQWEYTKCSGGAPVLDEAMIVESDFEPGDYDGIYPNYTRLSCTPKLVKLSDDIVVNYQVSAD